MKDTGMQPTRSRRAGRRRASLAAASVIFLAMVGALSALVPAAGAEGAAKCDIADFVVSGDQIDTTGYLNCVRGQTEGAPRPGADCPSADMQVLATADPAMVKPGQSTTLRASGFAGGTTVDIYLCSPSTKIATVTVGADGTLNTSVAVPGDASLGGKTLVAVGRTASGTQAAVAGLTVVSSSVAGAAVTAGNSQLPQTGSDLGRYLVFATVFLVLGGAALVGSLQARKRYAASPSA